MTMGKISWLSALVVAACVALSHAPDVQSQGALFEGTQVPVGPGSGQVILADVNGDRHLDLVTRHLLQRRIGVFIGNGKGGFTPGAANPIELAYQPGNIAIDDVNGDGTADLVAVQSERDLVDVLLGDSKSRPTRAPESPITAGTSRQFFTRMIRLLDANGDRRLDIVTANGRENSFGILFGDGRGHFAAGPIVRREVGPMQRHAFAFVDVTGDGNVDAVIATREDDAVPPRQGRIAVLHGNGRGEFQEAGPPLSVAPLPHDITLADINGDRHPDLVISHGESHAVSVLLNDGTGRFTPAPGSPVDVGGEAWTVVVADVDGDGRQDLLAAIGTGVTALLGDGHGRFTSAPGSPFPAGPGAYRVTTADINEDGKLDAAASSFDGSAVTVLLRR
jgi:VCBS repeat protein